jgi:pimeloyl-ACP methyl ester carboxylesterase
MADQPKSEERENQKERHLVILVHGINTFADWMPAMADTLESAGFLVSPTSFGDMRVSRFLLPIGRPRQQAIQRVLTNIRTAKELHKPDRISVITHSFGTYVVARILQREPWPWHRIIFCGSVLPEKFPLDEVRDRFTAPLLNEVGTRDIWPAMAAWGTWGYGSVGSYGFNHPTVRTRWHEGFRHSDFLTPDFCNKYWVPFLRDGTIIRGSDKPSRLPWTIRAITKIPAALDCAVFILGASRTWRMVHSVRQGNYD